ncbi:hypothetical protein M8C21_023862 [Ambrosia artemisiifolia]|uniref:Transposase (Putative), gypsy type n=1 Tax=Ambrosia artemisiifolia TaxID=4212 RepID=A0AAD5GB51_AMBAR|nr:hypothetical protein M8C21_023862 [Ambrosia artemisiifolia]
MLKDTYSGLKNWKNRFFWVPDNVVPFKMPWKDLEGKLNPKQEDLYDGDLYDKLLGKPTSLQIYPETILVLSGISRKWSFPGVEPIIKKGKKEMSVLGFIKRKGEGVVLTSRPLDEKEDFVLDRTASVTYSIPETEKDDIFRRPIGQSFGDRGNLDRFLHTPDNRDDMLGSGADGHVVGENEVPLNVTPLNSPSPHTTPTAPDKVVLGVEATAVNPTRKEHHKKRKTSEGLTDETPGLKKPRSSSDIEESKDSEESYDVSEPYVPRWTVKNGDNLSDPAVCFQILHHAIPPGELDCSGEKEESHPVENASVAVVRTLSCVSELVQSYFKKTAVEKKLRGRIDQYRAEITKLDAKLAKRKKGDRSSVKKGKEAIRAMGEMKVEHAKEVETLKQSLAAKDKEIESLKEENRLANEQNVALTKSSNALQERLEKAAEEKKSWNQCRIKYDIALEEGEKVMAHLRSFVTEAEGDRDRLISEIIPLVVSRLHKSTEFLQPLGQMETLLYNSAFHDGVVAGYKGCSAGLKVEDIEGYDPKANTTYEDGARAWDATEYEYLKQIQLMKGKTSKDVEGLLPSGFLAK